MGTAQAVCHGQFNTYAPAKHRYERIQDLQQESAMEIGSGCLLTLWLAYTLL